MSKRNRKNVFQMSTIQLKALMNKVHKVVDNACTFFLGDHLNFLSDGCLQCNNGMRIVLVDVVLEDSSVVWGAHSNSTLLLMTYSWNFSLSHVMVTLPVWGLGIILQEPLFFFIMVFMHLKFFQELLKHWNVIHFYPCHCIIMIIFKEKWCNGALLWYTPCTFLNAEGI